MLLANFFKDTITLFLLNKNSQEFDKYIIKNVYFRHSISTRMTEEGLIKTSNGSITIPMKYAQLDNLNIEDLLRCETKNSYVIKGTIDSTSNESISYNELIKNYNVFRLISVADNRKGGLQHIKLEVEA